MGDVRNIMQGVVDFWGKSYDRYDLKDVEKLYQISGEMKMDCNKAVRYSCSVGGGLREAYNYLIIRKENGTIGKYY